MGIFSRAPKPITESPAPSESPFLRTIQTCLRSLQLTAAVVVLAIYSYTLGALSNRGLSTPTGVRAVEGIVGITVAYALLCIVLLRVFPTRTFPAFVLIVLDVAFAASWIYVGTANGGGTSCSGEVDTHFGKGKAEDDIKGKSDGFMSLPSYGDACRLLTACLAIAIITIFMFLGSVATTIFLGRAHHTQKRKVISAEEPDSSYPPLDSPKPDQEEPAKQKFSLKNFFRRRSAREPDTENALPPHTHPTDLSGRRPSLQPDQQYGYVNPGTDAVESDIGLSGNRRGYQPVPAAQAQERPGSPETVYTEYDPRRSTPPPFVSHQYREEPYSQADMWRPVDITGGPPSADAASARFPQGPYENLRGSSMRAGHQGHGQGRLPQTAYRYGDGVYDA